MAAPISRLPLSVAALSVLQARPVPRSGPEDGPGPRTNLPQRERPLPPTETLAAIPARGTLLDIIA